MKNNRRGLLLLGMFALINVASWSCKSASGANTLFSDNVESSDDVTSVQSKGDALKVVVIDPGHGGADPGANGSFTNEKTITLAIGKKVQILLSRMLPNAKVLLTRSTDVTQSVKAKATYANEHNADLFVSIHCNSASAPKSNVKSSLSMASGTESYIWNLNKNLDKKQAIIDQDVRLGRKVSDGNLYYQMKLRQCFTRSTGLAKGFEEEFDKIGRGSRMARQRPKGIWVLQATSMPSVLIETGFISNPKEEKYLASASGELEMAKCIATAIVKYNNRLTSTNENSGKTKFKSRKRA